MQVRRDRTLHAVEHVHAFQCRNTHVGCEAAIDSAEEEKKGGLDIFRPAKQRERLGDKGGLCGISSLG